MEFLGLETKEWAVGEGSRQLRHWAFIKKVVYYRDLLDRAIQKFLELAKRDDTYTWDDVFAKNDNDLVNELKIAREAGLISQYNAIKRYNKYTEEEAMNEMELLTPNQE